MKKSMLALSMLALAVSANANARDGLYVSGAYSMMYHDAVFTSSNDVENGFAAAFGYDFPIGSFFVLGAEFEYKDLGSTTEKASSDSFKVSMSSVGVNLLPKVYFGDGFHLLGKLGYHKIDADIQTTILGQATTSASDSATLIGVGLGYDFTKHIGLQTTYEIHNVASYNTASANIAVKVSF
ncbi:porin family protein [Vibrio sp. 404]|uniref:Porin family protein n=1 Tax=Vibrio marinisediminis TaxID=2758441 RepID=A0A7W2FP76_9VIBR|nr:outer membrane beta-barrel protein [Vibrio marinisediminis]MBA5761732.1 porin family protein [Vibrio marinisediminis]